MRCAAEVWGMERRSHADAFEREIERLSGMIRSLRDGSPGETHLIDDLRCALACILWIKADLEGSNPAGKSAPARIRRRAAS